ncbi:hypothetical protein SESBI_21148 [Sesbania bispinosa]|nr:hypothetical protein SESBI_21148 [Sesbania bispinosa]
MWPQTQYEEIPPPIFKLGHGRPKKLRRREPDEDPNPRKLKRSHSTNKCSRCGELGYNIRKCKMPPSTPPNEPADETTNVETKNVAPAAGEEQAPMLHLQ